ncbi:MAG TPA: WecB/TagA/CpsF family glycosyltransferase [Candidatus Limnocylindria bacterium]|nr:WecB/TagA/CpsF family glycosyltransferase [Candidatus Limnocylindria bacterium]
MTSSTRVRLLDVPMDMLDMTGTLDVVRRHVEDGRPGAHLGINAANLMLARDDPAYLAHLSAADVVTVDGQWVLWGARLLDLDLAERVTGIDLMQELLAEARCREWAVYLVGARPEVVRALARRLGRSGIRVAGYRDGYFGPDASRSIAEAVKASGAQLLFVGLPSPQKERFIIEHARPAGVPFSIGVGGSFDVLSGRLRRAPKLLQRMGLEGFFRFAQEPRRLLGPHGVMSLRFVWLLARQLVRRHARPDRR